MVGISVWDEKEIDTDSLETKEWISTLLKEYIIKNWHKCVFIEKATVDNICAVQFKIEL